MPGAARELRVRSGGLTLSVREHGSAAPGRQHVVMVHGYPDDQRLWDPVIAELDLDRLHVVTYDVRGAGGSDAPGSTDGYRTALLVDDLVAVVDATVPDGEPVHLVGHDWGAVQLWDAVAVAGTDHRLRGRVASFTSVSGASLDNVAHLIRSPRGRQVPLLRQWVRSSYVYAFHVPVVPELLWRGLGALLRSPLSHRVPGGGIWGPEVSRNGRNGLRLYRANVLQRMCRPGRLRTDVPVLVVHPRRDPFLTEVLLEDLEEACADLTVTRLDAGHWVPRTHPRELAELVTRQVLRTSAD